jgi:hypothetical protein
MNNKELNLDDGWDGPAAGNTTAKKENPKIDEYEFDEDGGDEYTQYESDPDPDVQQWIRGMRLIRGEEDYKADMMQHLEDEEYPADKIKGSANEYSSE